MIITNAKYQIDAMTGIKSETTLTTTIDEVVMAVPIDSANRHYQAILEWVADGNTIADAD